MLNLLTLFNLLTLGKVQASLSLLSLNRKFQHLSAVKDNPCHIAARGEILKQVQDDRWYWLITHYSQLTSQSYLLPSIEGGAGGWVLVFSYSFAIISAGLTFITLRIWTLMMRRVTRAVMATERMKGRRTPVSGRL